MIGRPNARVRLGRPTDFGYYWCGQTTSTFGSVLTAVAVPIVAVVYLDASPRQVSLVSAASVAPLLVFGLPAGVLADRVRHPRRLLMVLDAVSAVAVAWIAFGVAHHVASVGWLVAFGAVEGCVTTLIEVVYLVHLRQLIPAVGIGHARARLLAGQYAAGLAGRLLAGPIIVAFGAATALLVDGVSYAVSLAALLTMTPLDARPQRRSRAPTARPGIIQVDRFHRALMVCLIVPGAASSGVGTLTAPFLLRVLAVPTAAYGWLFAGCGVLGMAGSMLAGRLSRYSPRRITFAALAASMVCGVLLPIAAGPLPMTLICAALGISLPVFFGAIANVALGSVLMADIPEDATGRVVAALQVSGAAAGLVGALVAGALGGSIGVRHAIWVLDVVALAALVVTAPTAGRAAGRPWRAHDAGDHRHGS